MPAFASYLLSMVILYFLSGAILYNLDIAFGVPVVTWWYNLTHKSPLPDGQEKGFIFRRPTKVKGVWAVLISSAFSIAVMYYSHSVNIVVEVFAWAVQVPCMLFGMHILGRPLGNLWSKREHVYQKLDALESGETTLSAEARRIATTVAGRARGLKDELAAAPKPQPVSVEPAPVPVESAPVVVNDSTAAPEPQPEEDPTAGMKKFNDKYGIKSR